MNLVAHYREGSSDKVYIVSVAKSSTGGYKVVAKWGRIWKSVQSQVKYSTPNLTIAQSEARSVFATKTKKGYVDIESSHYNGPLTMGDAWLSNLLEDAPTTPAVSKVDEDKLKREVRSLLKRGRKAECIRRAKSTLNLDEPSAKSWVHAIEVEVKAEEAAEAAKAEPEETTAPVKDFEVICVDNTGMEDSFDEGVEYVAEPHAEEGMIYVWDRNAQKRECFAERFKKNNGVLKSIRDMRDGGLTMGQAVGVLMEA
jgi:predicted DNA-binding WGR domain protein